MPADEIGAAGSQSPAGLDGHIDGCRRRAFDHTVFQGSRPAIVEGVAPDLAPCGLNQSAPIRILACHEAEEFLCAQSRLQPHRRRLAQPHCSIERSQVAPAFEGMALRDMPVADGSCLVPVLAEMKGQRHTPHERGKVDIGRRGIDGIAAEDDEARDLSGTDCSCQDR